MDDHMRCFHSQMSHSSPSENQGYNHNQMFLLCVRTDSDECVCLIVMCCVWRALQVPVTDYSFEDCQLAMAEGQILPVDTCLLEFAKLVRSLGWVSLSLQNQHAEDEIDENGTMKYYFCFPKFLFFSLNFLLEIYIIFYGFFHWKN